MLEEKYLHCPYISEIKGVSWEVGRYYVGVWDLIPCYYLEKNNGKQPYEYEEDEETYNVSFLTSIDIYRNYKSYLFSTITKPRTPIEISKDLAYLIKDNEKLFNRISRYVQEKFSFDNFNSLDYTLDLFYLTLYYFWKYINNDFSDRITTNIIFSFGITKVVKRLKNGERILEFGDGKRRIVKRHKIKGLRSKRIRTVNRRTQGDGELKGKTVFYTLIKAL